MLSVKGDNTMEARASPTSPTPRLGEENTLTEGTQKRRAGGQKEGAVGCVPGSRGPGTCDCDFTFGTRRNQ